jgi:hypothetical protein
VETISDADVPLVAVAWVLLRGRCVLPRCTALQAQPRVAIAPLPLLTSRVWRSRKACCSGDSAAACTCTAEGRARRWSVGWREGARWLGAGAARRRQQALLAPSAACMQGGCWAQEQGNRVGVGNTLQPCGWARRWQAKPCPGVCRPRSTDHGPPKPLAHPQAGAGGLSAGAPGHHVSGARAQALERLHAGWGCKRAREAECGSMEARGGPFTPSPRTTTQPGGDYSSVHSTCADDGWRHSAVGIPPAYLPITTPPCCTLPVSQAAPSTRLSPGSPQPPHAHARAATDTTARTWRASTGSRPIAVCSRRDSATPGRLQRAAVAGKPQRSPQGAAQIRAPPLALMHRSPSRRIAL